MSQTASFVPRGVLFKDTDVNQWFSWEIKNYMNEKTGEINNRLYSCEIQDTEMFSNDKHYY